MVEHLSKMYKALSSILSYPPTQTRMHVPPYNPSAQGWGWRAVSTRASLSYLKKKKKQQKRLFKISNLGLDQLLGSQLPTPRTLPKKDDKKFIAFNLA